MRHLYLYLPVLLTFLLTSCDTPLGGKGGGGGSMLPGLIPFILIFALFYFLILRPQQKQSREKDNMLKSLKRGDGILTTGGIYGKITSITGDVLSVEIAKGLIVKVSRSGILGTANASDEERKAKEGKSDK